jgi:ice-binding like protein
MPRTHGAGAAERVVAAGRPSAWFSLATALALLGAVLLLRPLAANAATTVDLGTAANFAVLAGQGVTNVNSVGTVLEGDLGTHPNLSITGFPPGIVNGATEAGGGVALQAKNDLTAAYIDAAGQGPATTIATQLGGETLTPDVYDSGAGTFQITGTLTLDGQGDPNAVFIFQMATTLVTASGSDVQLIGNAQACNIFWQVGSSATLDTNSDFTGNILALTQIEAHTGATVEGRLLARNDDVTLDANPITAPTCAAPTTTTPPGAGSSSATSPPGAGSTSTQTAQVVRVPSGGPQTGGGSTAGLQNLGLFVLGGALLAAAGGTFAMRRRAIRHG